MLNDARGRAHWSAFTDDPMDASVIAARRALLRSIRRPPVNDRAAYVCSLAAGRRVLDLGVVDHTLDSERADRWLHGRLAGVSGELLGIDVVPDQVEVLRRRGFDVECMDVTTGDRPPGRWDLIVAGELLEHLGHPGGLFEAAADLLTEDGVFILSTPNPYAVWRVVQNLQGRPEDNVDHALLVTGWGIAELAERAGLRLNAVRGISAPSTGWKERLTAALLRWHALPVVPESICESMLYEVRRP